MAWWYGGDANAYADSLADPGDVKVFQRHWIGLTSMEAELPAGPLATGPHATVALAQRERDCYNSAYGLLHTGTGPTSDPAGNRGPSCDSVVSTVQSDRETFSLNSAVMAVAEGNYGRLGPQRLYTDGNARIQLDPSVWEMPGAMPEIAPSPDFPANIDHDFLSRSSMLQAWGAYGRRPAASAGPASYRRVRHPDRCRIGRCGRHAVRPVAAGRRGRRHPMWTVTRCGAAVR